jgi:hypothetical protein
MHASAKGAFVAAVTVLALAIGCALMSRLDPLEGEPRNVFSVIAVIYILPALVVGSALGEYMGEQGRSPFVRWFVVTLIGCICTVTIGVFGQLSRVILPSCILVAVGASVLERWTRPFDYLPVARALRHGGKFRRRRER